MGRIQGLTESGIISADTSVKALEGYVFHLTIAWRGWTAGEFCTLVDGVDAAGSDEVMIVFPTVNGTMELNWAQGKHFSTGIFFNKGATAAGSVFAEMTYK